ncbi:MAG: prepilin-type N-terminal cleavage/methylation domain-containing protein [Lachnospiraceae bacterium]|nr:prepilin-type N-terminal cleavage/methylation domain-containing protein [Lachnospiraceae bacterium]
MAKNNNKGFSLLEIVVAITILTLLLTPILQQLAQTMSTNRRTKEQQYANENAEYVLQYMQATPQEDIATSASASPDLYYTNADSTVEATRQCKLCYVDASGAVQNVYVDAINTAVVDYKTYTYAINDIELGPRQTVYNRTVVMDDLSVKVNSFTDKDGKAYRISYNNSVAPEGYELTDEGCIVKYETLTDVDVDGDGEDDRYISEIICEEYSGAASTNPNELNIGNMHDLDASRMALINGYATEYDDQARDDFYLEIMELYKNSTVKDDRDKWTQEVNGQNAIASTNYASNIRKLTILNIIKDDTNNCYTISVDVVYEGDLSTTGGVTKFVQKQYTAWTQEFPYDVVDNTCPEIYLEYQPFSTETEKVAGVGGSVDIVTFYASKDYLLINNQVKDAKIYLYKPLWDQATATYYDVSQASIVESLDNNDNYYVTNDYAADAGHTANITKVNVNVASANAITDDNKFTIYTSLNLQDDRVATPINPQFTYDVSIFTTSFKDRTDEANVKPRIASAIDSTYIKAIDEEESKDDRLFTVTVTLTPEDENCNSVTFTGAKGAN